MGANTWMNDFFLLFFLRWNARHAFMRDCSQCHTLYGHWKQLQVRNEIENLTHMKRKWDSRLHFSRQQKKGCHSIVLSISKDSLYSLFLLFFCNRKGSHDSSLSEARLPWDPLYFSVDETGQNTFFALFCPTCITITKRREWGWLLSSDTLTAGNEEKKKRYATYPSLSLSLWLALRVTFFFLWKKQMTRDNTFSHCSLYCCDASPVNIPSLSRSLPSICQRIRLTDFDEWLMCCNSSSNKIWTSFEQLLSPSSMIRQSNLKVKNGREGEYDLWSFTVCLIII